MYYVYVLKSLKDGKWYTGFTNDLKRRISEHNSGADIATKGRKPLILLYYEASKNEKDARAREKYLKTGMGKRYIKNRLKFFFSE